MVGACGGLLHGTIFAGYGWAFQFLILAAFLLIFWWLFRGQRFGLGSRSAETPLDIVQRRYAAGEITKTEYESLKQELRGTNSRAAMPRDRKSRRTAGAARRKKAKD